MFKVIQKYYDNGKTEANYKETLLGEDSIFEEKTGYDLYIDIVGTEEEARQMVRDCKNA